MLLQKCGEYKRKILFFLDRATHARACIRRFPVYCRSLPDARRKMGMSDRISGTPNGQENYTQFRLKWLIMTESNSAG